MTYEFLQQYWWFVIAILGGLLAFLMFVQGANLILAFPGVNTSMRRIIVNSTGRKWELTFTTLVTFGGAFFASFPLFYSTSFGGAYWVWILLLLTFVFQAVSYEFQNKKGNLIGSDAFRVFLIINGILAPLLVGTAVGTFFTGSDFIINKDAVSSSAFSAVSVWGSGWHGLEAVKSPAVILGLALLFLDASLGCLYLINNVRDDGLEPVLRKKLTFFSLIFLLFFIIWTIFLLTADGFAVSSDGTVILEKNKYFYNFIHMPAIALMYITGALLVIAGLFLGAGTHSRKGIWPAGTGTVLTVIALFLVAGYGGTSYYPSISDLQSSLTIQNSCSSRFTLKVMFYVSLLIPFVAAYIVYAWRKMNRTPITEEELTGTENKY
ncbi:MAG: cytochrome d ubiquinol oxidase subunit II [Bacteroidales bacterium]|jgi:cytochrome d ubiquinol oxidase subunit II|nr:cytochrome d ubiquinol oxidase subunit II [Bacteroidales bacterium]MCI1784871.1 cytochrome d ubiquinol oxidase subunit II [Bacteroidales bacterium]